MRIEKNTLNDALRVLGKVVCQTSPVELYQSVRFVGDVDGVMVMATDGKQLLHLPCVLSLVKDVTIPFPSALLAAKTSEMGVLQVWDKFFQIEIGNFSWHGKLLEGQYPQLAWRNPFA